MMKSWTLDELATSFLQSGFWPQEALIVVPQELYGSEQLVVVEGNRRLATKRAANCRAIAAEKQAIAADAATRVADQQRELAEKSLESARRQIELGKTKAEAAARPLLVLIQDWSAGEFVYLLRIRVEVQPIRFTGGRVRN